MSECILKLDNISYGYDNTRKILDNVTYEFKKMSCIQLLDLLVLVRLLFYP